ncbi:MAG: hypothetical protein IJT21_02265 [Synergistaceae bacterium]|nr:hypothetical protein [Synergistaceae bacterium]
MNHEKFNKYFGLLVLVVALLTFAAITTGGCGGSAGLPDTIPESEDVFNLVNFVKDSSVRAKKGDILLWYQENGADFHAELDNNPVYVTRLSKALDDGAVLAFINIQAEMIDVLTASLDLNLPPYLPDDPTESE